MSTGLVGVGLVWSVVLDRFERHAPAGVMARLALEHALPSGWVDEVFEAHRQRQYSRELLFSTVVELTTLVSLGLRPSLHAAARQMPSLPVSLASLYDKVNHTEPGVLRALVRGSAERLAPVMATLGTPASLPGWQVRVLDGNHLPGSEKRLLYQTP
jgi:IS4 transposase